MLHTPPRLYSDVSLTDLFAGAGGSSTGATRVPGVVVKAAANHWPKAVEVHNANHPSADHICADISQVNPRRFPRTTLLWGSPECTNHTRAKGKPRVSNQPDLFGETLPDEAAERSRATMWDIPRFAEIHEYEAVVVENVVEARDWPPFNAWLQAMHSFGYEHEILYINSMHAQKYGDPAAQSRDRKYSVFYRKGNRRPDFERIQRPKAYCPTCDEVVDSMKVFKDPRKQHGRYKQQYVFRCPRVTCRGQIVEPGWLPASSIIDWSLTGQRIGDRARPLKEKTLSRIAKGIDRYWRPNVDQDYAPILTPVEGREGKAPSPVTHPIRTLTTRSETGLAFPPFIAELRGGRSTARPAAQPLSTVTASGKHHGLVLPYYGSTTHARPDSEPVGAVTTRDRYALVARHDVASGRWTLPPGTVPEIDDCTFRMLEPSEYAAAMAFPDDYRWSGTRRERVRMAGNAVTPPSARDIIAAVVESLTGEEVQCSDGRMPSLV